MKDTTSTYWVQACMFQKRDCINQWRMLLTMYGYCLQDRVCFNPLVSLKCSEPTNHIETFLKLIPPSSEEGQYFGQVPDDLFKTIRFHRLSRNLSISGPHQDISDGGRTASLSIVFAFNKSCLLYTSDAADE